MSYRPSAIESRCLEHLDHAENWRMLDREMPPKEEVLPWRPFRRIFLMNVVVFAVVFGLLGLGAVLMAGPASSGDIVVGVGGGGVLTLGFAGLSAFLYRQSWNRRARAYLEE